MVIVIPVAEATAEQAEALVSFVEDQGGMSKHAVLVIHDLEDGELAARVASKLAPHCQKAVPARAKHRTMDPGNLLFASTLRLVGELFGNQYVLWMEPGILPATPHAFDLVEATCRNFPRAALVTGRISAHEGGPSEVVAFPLAAITRSPAFRKVSLVVDRSWRSVLSLLRKGTVCVPTLNLSEDNCLFTTSTETATPPKKRAAKKAAKKAAKGEPENEDTDEDEDVEPTPEPAPAAPVNEPKPSFG